MTSLSSSCTHFFLLLATTLCCCTCIAYLFLRKKNSNYRLPPGPWGLPILGSLHMMGDLPHQSLCKLSKKYGSMMFIRLGIVPAVVISSPEMAEVFLKTHEYVFSGRPILEAVQFLTYGQKGLVFSQCDDYWRYIRKFCTFHLLSHLKIESFKSMRREEVRTSVESINDLLADHQSSGGDGDEVVVDLSEKIASLVEDITCRMLIGTKLGAISLKPVLNESFRLIGAFNLADYVPFIGALDLQGFNRRMKVVKSFIDILIEKIIEDHLHDAKEQEPKHQKNDFVDAMLSLMNTEDGRKLDWSTSNIKALILDMFAAIADTATTTIEWVLSELIKHPRVMKLVQKELESVVGLERMVEEIDLVKLDYLEMVIKETMRLHPIVPFNIRVSTEDLKINGYDIPKKSRLLVNVWGIGRDPNIWSNNAEEFYPERFVGSDINFRGNDFRLIPFGSGRRGCPGMQLGLTMVRLILAQLVHCFNWELPNGMSPQDLDMAEKFGLTLSKAKHLLAVPTYRLDVKNFSNDP